MFFQPNVTAKVFNFADKSVPRLNQRNFVLVAVAVVPSMSKKYIDAKPMFNAIINRTDIKTMES